MSLSEKIQDNAIRDGIAADCAKLVDQHVAAKTGLSGMALKTAYGLVIKGLGANYVPGAIGRVLPDACRALDGIWAEGLQTGDPVEHLSQNRTLTADTLLSVTDARIERTDNGMIRSSYGKLRKSVKSDIEAAVPELARILANHVQEKATVAG